MRKIQIKDIPLWIKIFVATFCFMMMFHLIFRAQGDDFDHYFKAIDKNWKFYNSYFVWCARIGEIFYTGYFAKFNDTLFLKLLASLVATLFCIGFFTLIFGRVPKNKEDVLSFIFIAFCLITLNDFAATMLWNSGWVNYLFGFMLIVYFLLPFRLYYQSVIEKRDFKLPFYLVILMIPVVFCAGMASEHMGLWSICFTFLFLVYQKIKNIKIPWWQFFLFLIFSIGWLCLYFSPGNAARMAAETKLDYYIPLKVFFSMSFFEQITIVFKSFNHLYNPSLAVFIICSVLFFGYKAQVKSRSYIFLFLGAIVLLPIIRHVMGLIVYMGIILGFLHLAKKESKFYIFALLFSSWVFVGLIVFQIGSLAQRARFGDNLILYILLLGMFLDVYMNAKSKILVQKILIGAFIVSSLACYGNWAYVRYKWYQMDKSLAEQKAQGIKDAVISASTFKWLYRIDWVVPLRDKNYYLNERIAKLYGFDSITAE